MPNIRPKPIHYPDLARVNDTKIGWLLAKQSKINWARETKIGKQMTQIQVGQMTQKQIESKLNKKKGNENDTKIGCTSDKFQTSEIV